MDSRKPLTAGQIARDTVYAERVTNGKECGENCPCSYVNLENELVCVLGGKELCYTWEQPRGLVYFRNTKCLSTRTPPPDAAVKEAVEFSVEARCSRLARGILRISKKLRVMRADMASQTAALIAAMHAINDAGLLMPDEVLDYTSGVRAAQGQRLTGERLEVLRDIEQELYDHGHVRVHKELCAAFPELGG